MGPGTRGAGRALVIALTVHAPAHPTPPAIVRNCAGLAWNAGTARPADPHGVTTLHGSHGYQMPLTTSRPGWKPGSRKTRASCRPSRTRSRPRAPAGWLRLGLAGA